MDYPDDPNVVFSAINRNVSIPCDLDFADGEQLQMFMWSHNTDLITYKGKDGAIKYSYPMLKEKYFISDNYSLEIVDIGVREAGNYTCKKMVLERQSDGSVNMVEKSASKELIVQGGYKRL